MAVLITPEQIAKICKCDIANLSNYIPFLDESLRRFAIKTPQSLGAFFSTLGIESANFRKTKEMSTGAQYENRKDLGNIVLGDGIKFKGRGLIQITGRNNYRACSLALYGNDCLINAPSILEAPKDALLSACWYWADRGLNDIAKLPESYVHDGQHQYNKAQWIRVKVNGGLNDFDAFNNNYVRARTVLHF